ncbi:gluconokinase [Modestobacter marinus]|uniref:Gluconokinase n=1 Tax=Modestobacter marinus TaxID=477641 RepID=A0A846M221_9ACTN|nr:gluconokinase [Modestobacter marinus]NIH68580.1 gluconokinase [Modestobacter marinus]GGL58380.1 sugar kinase [Modestobacter marinus]
MSSSTGRVVLADALDPLVLALDVGSTASRGDVYDAAGRPVEGGRQKVAHQFRTAADGTSEIDPDQVVDEIARVVTDLTARLPEGRVAGVALDTFASSLVGVGADGRAVTPCYTYADSRCGPQVTALRRELDEARVQQRTGCRLHSSYLPARLRWLRETDPDRFAAARRWTSLGEYVWLRLLGTTAAGTSTAAWTGLLDRRTGRWDPEMLDVAGVGPDQLSEVRDPDHPLSDVDPEVGRRWPALAGARWFAPIADGFASNLGAGADDETTAALAAATSGAVRVLVPDVPEHLPPGLWCYRVDSRRSLLGGALNDVGRVITWLQGTVQLGEEDPDRLMAAAPDPATPLVLPYLSGERSTGWAASARAVLSGVSTATDGPALFRGAMEGVALSYGRIADQLRAAGGEPQRIVASGRVAQELPGWLQVVADVLGAPVEPVTIKRATLHGTALHALEVLAPEIARAPVETAPTLHPVPAHREHYRRRAAEYDQLYRAVIAQDAPA